MYGTCIDNNYTYITAESGVIRTSSLLDFESVQIYSLVVRATDNGRPIRSGECVLSDMYIVIIRAYIYIASKTQTFIYRIEMC